MSKLKPRIGMKVRWREDNHGKHFGHVVPNLRKNIAHLKKLYGDGPFLIKEVHNYSNNNGLVVYGHIHSGRGSWQVGPSKLINATLVDDNYNMVYQPVQIEL